MKKITQLLFTLALITLMILIFTGCTAEQIQGPPGPQGQAGEQGIAGPQGEPGAQGEPAPLATTGEVTFTIPGYGLSSPGNIVIEVSHEIEGVKLPPYISLGIVSEYGIIIGNDFIFGFQNYLERMIAGQDESLPQVAFTVFDITTETFKIAVMCTEQQPTTITIRWWAIPAQ
jgi:hypothetical protein